MKQNVIIALAVIATVFAGYAVLSHQGSQNEVLPESTGLRAIYNQWKFEHNIKVGSTEDDLRFKVFSANYDIIQKHNSNPKATSKFGLNQFSHLTSDEFSALYLKSIQTNTQVSAAAAAKPSAATEKLFEGPDAWDWEKQGKVTPVIDQGQCGSSYAFPAVGAVETLIANNGGELTPLSVQQTLDCGKSYGTIMGCNGGMPYGVLEYIRDNGIVSEADYPYTATDGQCKIPSGAARVTIGGYVNVTGNSAEAFKDALYKSPVTAGMDAQPMYIQFYKSGILSTDNCSQEADHGVLAVGYGTENGTDFWRIKNTWGSAWGENGYFRLERGNGACGLYSIASYPTN